MARGWFHKPFYVYWITFSFDRICAMQDLDED